MNNEIIKENDKLKKDNEKLINEISNLLRKIRILEHRLTKILLSQKIDTEDPS